MDTGGFIIECNGGIVNTTNNGLFSHDRSSSVNGDKTASSIPLYDAEPTNSQASIGTLVRRATEEISALIRGEIELAKTELATQVKRGLVGSGFFVAAVLCAMTSILPFIFFLAKLISLWFGTKSWDWMGFLIVFILMIIAAIVFVILGWRKVKKIQAPKATVQSVKDLKEVLPKSTTTETNSVQ